MKQSEIDYALRGLTERQIAKIVESVESSARENAHETEGVRGDGLEFHKALLSSIGMIIDDGLATREYDNYGAPRRLEPEEAHAIGAIIFARYAPEPVAIPPEALDGMRHLRHLEEDLYMRSAEQVGLLSPPLAKRLDSLGLISRSVLRGHKRVSLTELGRISVDAVT